jgi:SRSO17 transposase
LEIKALESRLSAYKDSMRSLFFRRETHKSACGYLTGLMGKIERKNSWQLSEGLGKTTPYQLQRLLGTSVWDEEGCRDFIQDYSIRCLGPSGTCIFDDTGFLKKGKKSAGVQRQYTGTAGRVENCQIGVFAAWRTPHGHTLIDRELYLPLSWMEDEKRCEEAGIPKKKKFQTKQQLALLMYDRLLKNGHKALWIVADEAYGRDQHFRKHLEKEDQGYVLAVPKDHRVRMGLKRLAVEKFTQKISSSEWHRLSCREGTKGERLADWSLLPTSEKALTIGFCHFILAKRSLKDPKDFSYYHVYAKKEETLENLVKVSGQRWPVEECFEMAKNETGLDQYEVRSYKGWYRHITLSMMALAFLVTQRAALEEEKEQILLPQSKGSLDDFKKNRKSHSILYSRN